MRILMVCLVMLAALAGGCGPTQTPQEDGSYKKQVSEPELTVYMHETGKTEKLKMETYLEGVVAGEMRNDWDLNALAAQAIIARTFTLQAYEKGSLTSQGTNASTDIKEFQAYNAAAINSNIKQAVAQTRGKVATYQGIPIMGWFHASAGGRTATAKEGLDYPYEEPPFTQSVASPDELAPEDVRQWTAVYSVEQVRKALSGMQASVASIDQIRIGKKGKSGRAEIIVINDSVEVSGPKLRLALGSTELKSMLLDTVWVEGNQVTFKGRGYGHGVGLSQWGAFKMAQSGRTPEEIVKHYFKGVTIEKRW